MLDFLKTMGQGILYFILSPFLLLLVLCYSIYSFILFFVMFIKRIIKFFKGEDMSISMNIDKVAKIHIENQDQEEEERQNAPLVNETKTIIHEQNTTVFQPIFIQTDEEGRVKGYSYMQPNNPPNDQTPVKGDNPIVPEPPKVEEIPDLSYEINKEEIKDEEEEEHA